MVTNGKEVGTIEQQFSIVFSCIIALALYLALLHDVKVHFLKWAATGSHEA